MLALKEAQTGLTSLVFVAFTLPSHLTRHY